MNRITIEPGALPNTWSHIWLRNFTHLLLTVTDSPQLNDVDIHFLKSSHVNPSTNAGRENLKDSDILAQPEAKRIQTPEPGQPPTFYSPSEKESQRRSLAARRIQHQNQSDPQ